jgi:hypothetical protein
MSSLFWFREQPLERLQELCARAVEPSGAQTVGWRSEGGTTPRASRVESPASHLAARTH